MRAMAHDRDPVARPPCAMRPAATACGPHRRTARRDGAPLRADAGPCAESAAGGAGVARALLSRWSQFVDAHHDGACRIRGLLWSSAPASSAVALDEAGSPFVGSYACSMECLSERHRARPEQRNDTRPYPTRR